MPILKIASSDINDWVLIEKIAKTRKPVIVSTGGCSLKDMDDLVTFFENRNIPLAINHCVSLYPVGGQRTGAEPDRLPARPLSRTTSSASRPTSTTTGRRSMLIAYAKGARTFERHIDIEADGVPVSPYCSLPEQVDAWFKAFSKAKEMCGAPGSAASACLPQKEDRVPRTAWCAGSTRERDLPEGHVLSATRTSIWPIPLQKGQISCRELMRGEVLLQAVARHERRSLIDDIDSPYASIPSLRELIER